MGGSHCDVDAHGICWEHDEVIWVWELGNRNQGSKWVIFIWIFGCKFMKHVRVFS